MVKARQAKKAAWQGGKGGQKPKGGKWIEGETPEGKKFKINTETKEVTFI